MASFIPWSDCFSCYFGRLVSSNWSQSPAVQSEPSAHHSKSTAVQSQSAADQSQSSAVQSQSATVQAHPPEFQLDPEGTTELHAFRYNVLYQATRGFSEDLILGEGGFGKVFKGRVRIPTGQLQIAVKKLNADSVQGQQEWLAEILTLGKLKHPNLVKLYGYCAEQGEGLLVYEFLPLGSLDYHLFHDEDETESPSEIFSFDKRLKIAFGVAKGLAYLHENNIIHRDFKIPNILLDKDYNAKLTDFGLAKAVDTNATHASTRVMGTMGYLDPNYLETGHLNRKSDVYAFGVLLLELLTGKKAMGSNGVPLTSWIQPYISRRKPDITSIVDPKLGDYFSTKATNKLATKFAICAKHCIDPEPKLRPLMSDMVTALKPFIPEEDGGSFIEIPF